MCHKWHYAIMPKNYRIFLPSILGEKVFPTTVTDEVMDQMFLIYSVTARRDIQHIIGEELFCSSALTFLYPSQLISIFLSNAMDLMQSPDLLHTLAQKVIHPQYMADNKLILAMQNYDLWNGAALVGGLFSHFQLQQIHEFFDIFEAIKKAIDTGSFNYLKFSFPSASNLMDVHLLERIKLVGQALIELQIDTTAPDSGDLHVDFVLPIEPNYWDFIDQVYLDLDGSHNSSEFCSG